MGHLRSDKLPINEQVDLNTSPRIRIVNDPSGNILRRRNRFTPTVESRRKRIQVDHERNRAHQNRLEYGFGD